MQHGWALLVPGVVSFVLSLAFTRGMIWLSPRIGFTDKPGHRKIHSNPKPLGGGVAIYWSFTLCLSMAAVVTMTPVGRTLVNWALPQPVKVHFYSGLRPATHPIDRKTIPATAFTPPAKERAAALQDGFRQQLPLLIGVLSAAAVLHAMGLLDDRHAMGPYLKLFIQLGVTASLVVSTEFLSRTTPSLGLRILTTLDQYGLGPWPSIVLTVLWVGAITNAFNFLDNMDGLSAGVAAVCTTAFLVTALSIGQWFVAATLAVFLGSLLGFLVFNFAPARIFMGDSGSLVVGFVLGVMTVRTTFLRPDETWQQGWYAVFAPLIVLAVPLYDMVVVSIIRLSNGNSPFKGDTNHFSHRLVARGMSRRTAVLCIYLVTAATSIAAVLLPQVRSAFGAMLICLQTLLVLGVVLLLEQHKPPAPTEPQS